MLINIIGVELVAPSTSQHTVSTAKTDFLRRRHGISRANGSYNLTRRGPPLYWPGFCPYLGAGPSSPGQTATIMARDSAGITTSVGVARSVGRVKSSISQPRHPLDLRLSMMFWTCSNVDAGLLPAPGRSLEAAAASWHVAIRQLPAPGLTLLLQALC